MNDKNLRIIKTARSEQEINAAVKEGYWPLVKPVIPSLEIKSKYAVFQHKKTGKIEVVHDFRAEPKSNDYVKVIDFRFYYPHHFESPFAAYLIPSDIAIGETVWISDLIEDVIKSSWNQGDTYRLESCEAIWDGADLINSLELKGNKFEVVG
jgi:hypothetical protein